MPPFADTVRFINRNQTDVNFLQEKLKLRHSQAFRRGVEDFYLPPERLRLNSVNFSPG